MNDVFDLKFSVYTGIALLSTSTKCLSIQRDTYTGEASALPSSMNAA